MPANKKLRPGAPTPVPLKDIERELNRRMKLVQGPGESPVVRACMSNLVVYCDSAELGDMLTNEFPRMVALHPARVILLIADPQASGNELESALAVRGHLVDPGRWVISEVVTLTARGAAVERLPYAVRSLLIGDLPVNLWWAAPHPPRLGGTMLYELAETAQQIIFDSGNWSDPAAGVAAASWIAQTERGPGQGRWRVTSDLNWRRLKYWRRLMSQALAPATAPGVLDSITEVLIEYGPRGVMQAWAFAGWLAFRLQWRLQSGRIQPGPESSWQFIAPRGTVHIRLVGHDEEPAGIRKVRVNCLLAGQPGTMNLEAQADGRLSAAPEGIDAAPRTVTEPAMALAELVARQLSDRERDPVFRESIAIAQQMLEKGGR